MNEENLTALQICGRHHDLNTKLRNCIQSEKVHHIIFLSLIDMISEELQKYENPQDECESFFRLVSSSLDIHHPKEKCFRCDEAIRYEQNLFDHIDNLEKRLEATEFDLIRVRYGKPKPWPE
jgi:hypothetical protein